MTRRTRLGFALDFTEADLAANQQGKISDSQKARLRREMRWAALGCSFPTLVMFGYFVASVNAGSDFPRILILLLLTLGLGAGTWFITREKQSDLRGGIVLSATGIAQTRREWRFKGGDAFYVTIDTLDFGIHPGAYYAFYPGNRYQVFYTPAEKRILSAVRLDDPQTDPTEAVL
jgi:hypothetical protein